MDLKEIKLEIVKYMASLNTIAGDVLISDDEDSLTFIYELLQEAMDLLIGEY